LLKIWVLGGAGTIVEQVQQIKFDSNRQCHEINHKLVTKAQKSIFPYPQFLWITLWKSWGEQPHRQAIIGLSLN